MSNTSIIHWHQGLFLQPQHLQVFQKGLRDSIALERNLAAPYSYGVIGARLAAEDLENYRLRFDKLHVVMPSGAHFRFPEEADLPSIDIKREYTASSEPMMIYLGVPLWKNQRSNVIDYHAQEAGKRPKIRFIVTENTVSDENTGEEEVEIQNPPSKWYFIAGKCRFIRPRIHPPSAGYT